MLICIHNDNLQCRVNHCSTDYSTDCCDLNVAHESLLYCRRKLGCSGQLLGTQIYTLLPEDALQEVEMVVKHTLPFLVNVFLDRSLLRYNPVIKYTNNVINYSYYSTK